MNNITEIKVEDYLKENLPQIEASNENDFLAEMGITKDKGEYVLDHNKFSKYMRKYINVVYQNNRSELAIYNYSQKKYEINYVNVLLEKIVKFFLSYVKELWTPKWEEVIIKTLKRDISTVVTNFDNGDYINLIDGILDLKDFELKPHSPDYYTTIQLPIAYHNSVETKYFDKFLDDITCSDKDLKNVLQEIVGYCLTNSTCAEKAFFFVGNGCNGKSVLAKIIQELVGQGNYSNTPLSALGGNFGLASLIGSNVNIAAENGNGKINSEMFKAVVSGDTVEINRKYREAISMTLHTKLIFLFNELPENADLTYGFYRKIVIVPFNRTFKGEEIDVEMFNKLKSEIAGIFQWAIEGLKRLKDNNYVFSSSLAIDKCLDNYKQEQNPVIDFFESCFSLGNNKQIKRSDIYNCYQKYCCDNSYEVLQCQKFWKMLKAYWADKEYLFRTKKIKGYEYFVGFDFKSRKDS